MATFTQDLVNNALVALAADRDNNLGGYQQQVLNTYQTLLDKVTTENQMIEKSYPSVSVAGQKSMYINQSATSLSALNAVLFWIYMIVAVILCIIVYIKPTTIWFKIVLVIVILGFPFYIYPAETLLYQAMMYIYSVLLSVVYTNGYGNTRIEYSVSGTEDLRKV